MKQFGKELNFLLLCYLVASIEATCNVCNTVNSLACYSLNQTQACDANNLQTGIPFDCPTGYVCVSTVNGVLCEPSGSGSVGECQDCNKCDATQTFACTGTSSFALCLGTDMPQNSMGNCAMGYVCNIDSTQICEMNVLAPPTCSYADDTTTTTTTTTIAPPTQPSTSNPMAFCQAVQSQGRFAVGYYAQTTCRQYIECVLVNGQWIGRRYTCPGSTYFDGSAGLCVTTMPSNCYTPISTTTTTTPAPTTSNPAAYCAKMQSQGYFPVGINPNSSCRQYIYCFLLNGSWSGHLYKCPGNLYYDSSIKSCVSSLPATCSAAVASLSLNGVQLK